MFQNDGRIGTSQPPRWRELPGSFSVYHHIVPYNQLRESWNKMTEIGMSDHRRLFLQRVCENAPSGYSGQGLLPIEEFLAASSTGRANNNRFDFIETAIAYQRYNLGRGPTHRPARPDPREAFDHLSVMPQHVQRIYHLREVSESMATFLRSARAGSVSRVADLQLGEAIESLGSLTHLEHIPQHDINWHGLNRKSWIQMSPADRQTYDRYLENSGMIVFDGPQSSEYATLAVNELIRARRIVPPPGFSNEPANTIDE